MLSKKKIVNYISLAVVISCAMYYYFSRGYISVIKDFLMDSAYIAVPFTATQFSTLSSAFSLTYGMGQPLGGYLMDKYGLKKVYPLMIALAALSTYLFAISTNFNNSVYCRYLLGFFFCVASTGSYRYISIAFEKHFSLFSNLLVVCMSIAAAFASSKFIKNIMIELGWVAFLKIYAVFGIVLAFLAFVVMSKKNKNEPNINNSSQNKSEPFSITDALKTIFNLKGYIFMVIFMFTLSSACYVLMEGWGNDLFYEKYKNLNLLDYSLPSVVNMYGNSCGYFYNIFVNKVSLKKQMIIYSLISIASISGVIFFNFGHYFFLACCFFIGFTSASQNIGFVFLKENLKAKYLGVAFGLSNFICMYFGCALMQKLAGILLDFNKKKTILNTGVNYDRYSEMDVMILFKMLLGISIVSFIVSLLFRNNSRNQKTI